MSGPVTVHRRWLAAFAYTALATGANPLLPSSGMQTAVTDPRDHKTSYLTDTADRPVELTNAKGQDISDMVGHKSTHVTETVYRHVIVPEIRGGATVMDDLFNDE